MHKTNNNLKRFQMMYIKFVSKKKTTALISLTLKALISLEEFSPNNLTPSKHNKKILSSQNYFQFFNQ